MATHNMYKSQLLENFIEADAHTTSSVASPKFLNLGQQQYFL